MTSGLSNAEKARIRSLYAEGKIGREELLESEMKAYHGPGTCTFYGTANSNQMVMEMMGLHLPGAAFVQPGHPAARRADRGGGQAGGGDRARSPTPTPRWRRWSDEKAIVNGVVGLLATGGSTNHTLHLVAMARAAGIVLTWDDFARTLAGHAADRPGLSERLGGRERTSTPPAAWPSSCASCWTPAWSTRT